MIRRAAVVVVLIVMAGSASSVPSDGSDLLARAVRVLGAGYEKRLGASLVSSELLPFESAIPGTMKWNSTLDLRGERYDQTKVLAEFPSGWVFMLTVAPHDDALTRSVLATLRAKLDDPDCYWPLFREMIKPSGIDGSRIEGRFRASAAAGKAEELAISSRDRIFIFSNGAQGICYTYAIPGKWRTGPEPSMYQTPDGRTQVGIIFSDGKDL